MNSLAPISSTKRMCLKLRFTQLTRSFRASVEIIEKSVGKSAVNSLLNSVNFNTIVGFSSFVITPVHPYLISIYR